MIEDPIKEHVLEEFATGFVSHFEYKPPKPWGSVRNYPPVKSPEGVDRLREAMTKQVLAGKMIGGEGWTEKRVTDFFGGSGFYGIPCGAAEKAGDPLGRIVHDYGFFPGGSYSVNATHSCTSVKFLTLKEIANNLDGVVWFIKADLASGYRQFGAHPVDWRFQVY